MEDESANMAEDPGRASGSRHPLGICGRLFPLVIKLQIVLWTVGSIAIMPQLGKIRLRAALGRNVELMGKERGIGRVWAPRVGGERLGFERVLFRGRH